MTQEPVNDHSKEQYEMLDAIQKGRKEGIVFEDEELGALRVFYRQRLYLGEFLGEETNDSEPSPIRDDV